MNGREGGFRFLDALRMTGFEWMIRPSPDGSEHPFAAAFDAKDKTDSRTRAPKSEQAKQIAPTYALHLKLPEV